MQNLRNNQLCFVTEMIVRHVAYSCGAPGQRLYYLWQHGGGPCVRIYTVCDDRLSCLVYGSVVYLCLRCECPLMNG